MINTNAALEGNWNPVRHRSMAACQHVLDGRQHNGVRTMPLDTSARDHIKKLDDCFGQFLVCVICYCGACRERADRQTFQTARVAILKVC